MIHDAAPFQFRFAFYSCTTAFLVIRDSMPRRKRIDLPPPTELGPLTEESLQALRNLASHVPDPETEPCPKEVPAFRRAAVLLGLFGGRRGDLYVILSQRASTLRSHGGDTAIPGGRFELADSDLEATARREAWEETGLPIDATRVRKLCELQPFLSANELVVTPIVVLLIDPMIKPSLNPKEVDRLFSLPLKAFLQHHPHPQLRVALKLGEEPTEFDPLKTPWSEESGPSDWHTCRDVRWFNRRVRRHTFWDTRNPVRGLTSDILIHCASLAYSVEPTFTNLAPDQPSQAELIVAAFTGPLAIRKRRVRPRMSGFEQPKDDDERRAEYGTKSRVPPGAAAAKALDWSSSDDRTSTSKSKL
ncbi:unnamed protein product [Jaminaea pallidilutea]